MSGLVEFPEFERYRLGRSIGLLPRSHYGMLCTELFCVFRSSSHVYVHASVFRVNNIDHGP